MESKTNCNVIPINGRSIVKGVIYLKAQQLQSKSVSNNTFFSGFYLEGTSTPEMIDHVGKEVLIDKRLQQELHLYKYDKVFNPKDADKIKELLDSSPGKAVNKLIELGTKIETWIYFLLWDNDIVGIIDENYKHESTGLLIPELDAVDTEGMSDEPNILKIESSLTNSKMTGDDVKRIIIPDGKA